MIKQKMSETPRTDEHLRWRRDNGLVAVISREFARGLEIELAEARAEIERLKKLQQFAIAINCAMLEADCDPEYLRGHECVAKHKLLSLLDLWRKKVRPRLPGFIDDEISKRDKLIEQMREALKGASAHFDRNYYSVKNDPDFEDLNDLWRAIEAALAAERGE